MREKRRQWRNLVNFINDATFPKKEPKAAVKKDRCDGCAICVDVCPQSCLSVIVNPKRKNNRIVKVAGELCSGCGACQGVCPKEAIFIPGLSTENLRAYVDKALEMNVECGESRA